MGARCKDKSIKQQEDHMLKIIALVASAASLTVADLSAPATAEQGAFEAAQQTTVIYMTEFELSQTIEYCGLEDCSDTPQNM
jgi:hypothetical protein